MPPAQPTGNVTGKITSESTGLPVPNATVKLYNGSMYGNAPYASATTDESGAFTIAGLAPGEYQLVVEAAGYGSALTVSPVRLGRTMQVNIRLPPEIANKSGAPAQQPATQPPAQPAAQPGAGQPAAPQDSTPIIAGAAAAIIVAVAYLLMRRKKAPKEGTPATAEQTNP